MAALLSGRYFYPFHGTAASAALRPAMQELQIGGWRRTCHDVPWPMSREACMTATGPSPSQQPIVPNTTIALVIYILYFVGYFTGITALIGVIMAHVQVGTAEPLLATHYRFQIRTFWIGLLYLVIGTILSFVIVGIAVLIWWFIWSLVRNIKGVLALNEYRPIGDPASWLFG
jgi:uncharacterized membrane protein